MVLTQSTTPSVSTIKAKKDVQTELVYWEKLPGRTKVIDFRTPEGEAEYKNIDQYNETHTALIRDIRGDEASYTLEKNGFQYFKHEVTELDDWSNEKKVVDILIPKTEELVREVTGATKIITFAHRIRCFASHEAQLADNRAPAHSVHSDFTAVGAAHHVETLVTDPAELERLRQTHRVMAINIWRPLKPVRRDPLAVCDWQTVDCEDEWIKNRFIFPSSWNELGKIAHSDRHAWYYLSDQLPSEPLVFVQYDSSRTAEGGRTLAHSAFVDPNSPANCPPRESLEIKLFAFVPL
ncbi:hypothetical protein ASPZODRAFT_62055 [Penicilliopsis zonata CBS 506.65]|uniref:TauD/TfdA-like domain-containing protein n=1 Tax=Penicilliopsis zonata CBS 506.65 TaxID=1073090 RepID=A0A1L9SMY6_9EURO|nr:hypothetical protein ASPZODRAFT_62055 [Penicilliopsis zonata CBS 506.65]OJJ48414.1 hypothetical protein ASPZODRAFT_62055 [Penicilliopsis zonata CBS 506.65]